MFILNKINQQALSYSRLNRAVSDCKEQTHILFVIRRKSLSKNL